MNGITFNSRMEGKHQVGQTSMRRNINKHVALVVSTFILIFAQIYFNYSMYIGIFLYSNTNQYIASFPNDEETISSSPLSLNNHNLKKISVDATCSDDVEECNGTLTNSGNNNNNRTKSSSWPRPSLLQSPPSLYSPESLQRSKDEILPIWMVEYLEWHAQQRRNITDETKYLVVRCIRREKCGGLSDRLKPMPYYIMVASILKRVLLIYWDKPCNLEHFLVPPTGGLDWRVNGTTATIDEIRSHKAIFNGRMNRGHNRPNDCTNPGECVMKLLNDERWTQHRVINILMYGGGEVKQAEKLFNHWKYEKGQVQVGLSIILGWRKDANVSNEHDLMEDIYRILFRPSEQVENAIDQTMRQLHLTERKFNVAHVRAKNPNIANIPEDLRLNGNLSSNNNVGVTAHSVALEVDMVGGLEFEGRTKEWIVGLFTNAIDCVLQLSTSTKDDTLPIYIASDTSEAVQYMQHNTTYSNMLVSMPYDVDVLHIDYDGNIGRNPSDFYRTFVDLYIMAMANCTSYAGVGFGTLPIRISGHRCTVQHSTTNCTAAAQQQRSTIDGPTENRHFNFNVNDSTSG